MRVKKLHAVLKLKLDCDVDRLSSSDAFNCNAYLQFLRIHASNRPKTARRLSGIRASVPRVFNKSKRLLKFHAA
jgi:hypothetical protein